MAWIERHADDVEAINLFALQQPDAISRIELAAWVVGKAVQTLNLVAQPAQLLRKGEAPRCRYGIEPLGEEKNFHRATCGLRSATRFRRDRAAGIRAPFDTRSQPPSAPRIRPAGSNWCRA